jgi:hypothetical protein
MFKADVLMQHSGSHISSIPWLSLPRLLRARKHYTAREVLQRLQVERADDPRTAAVHAAAGQIGVWSNLLSERMVSELGRSAQRLPTIVFWYRQGVSPCEIGRRLSPMGGAWDANRALDAAAALIAQALNRGDVALLAA